MTIMMNVRSISKFLMQSLIYRRLISTTLSASRRETFHGGLNLVPFTVAVRFEPQMLYAATAKPTPRYLVWTPF